MGHYGVYLNGTHFNLIVEGNRFFNAVQVNEEPRVGLIARNLGYSGDQTIYRNEFEGCPFGCRFLDVNRQVNQGLRFSCHNFINCIFAVDITSSPNYLYSPNNVGVAIAQGSQTTPTGNSFTWTGADILPMLPNQIWRQLNASANHLYYYSDLENLNLAEMNINTITSNPSASNKWSSNN